MKHNWIEVNKAPRSIELYRRCTNCHKEQMKITNYRWMRVTGYSWYPLVGRCKGAPNTEELKTNQEAFRA